MDEKDAPTNVYDLRLTKHEDGWIYGIFCRVRRNRSPPMATFRAPWPSGGIVRTRT
jgi:4-O-beta-D-mannosyl-D-glucose phosphorylase